MKQSTKIIIFVLFILQFLTITSIYFDVKMVCIILILLLLDGIGLAIMSVHFLRQHIKNTTSVENWFNKHK